MFSSNTSQVSSGGYEIQRSLRFNSADSTYLSRTPASATNRKTWTWSGWVKRNALAANQYVFNASPDSFVNTFSIVSFGAGASEDKFRFIEFQGGSQVCSLRTTQVFRDSSAWYHFVLAVDTTQATDTNRVKVYVNGVQITSFDVAAYPAQNTDLTMNNNVLTTLGYITTTNNFSGYMTEVNFIDGQALTPSSFGAFDAQTGVWGPTPYAGSYGTNGFYLNFSDNSNTTAATLGKDYSGNGNNWTPNNFSVSAGAGNDSLVDVPTNWGTDTGVGGSVRGNYATWNSILQTNDAANTYANGNLEVSATSSNWANGTISTNSGSYYFELTPTVGAAGLYLGINNTKTDVRVTAYSGGIEASPGGGSNQTGLASWSNGDIIGVAVNGVSKTVQFYRNGSTYGSQVTYTTALDLFPFARNAIVSSSTTIINAGQRPFAYTAPSGFKALNTQNLPTPTIGATTATQAGKFFNPVLYTGDRTARTISVGFQPDWVWVKSRNAADDHYLMNAVVGTGKYLSSNSTASEATNAATLTAYTSDGFSVGNTGTTNETGRTYVAWNWKANGAGVTNTAGSVTTTVSANTTSGFSIARGTLPASVGASYGHGLGVAPSFIIAKSTSTASDWFVYHSSLGFNQDIRLQTTAAASSTTFTYNSANASTVTIGGGNVNAFWGANTTWVWYNFAEVPGYSRFGSYTGNGSSDGPFVFCGFRPAYLLVKCSSNAGTNWIVYDTTRDTINVAGKELLPNTADAEGTYPILDFLSNGFKMRNAAPSVNGSGYTYVFAAFASAPQKFALAR